MIPPPPSLYFNLFAISNPLKTLRWESFSKGYGSTELGRRCTALSGLRGDIETPLISVGAGRDAGEPMSRVSTCRRTTGLIKSIGGSNLTILRSSFATGQRSENVKPQSVAKLWWMLSAQCEWIRILVKWMLWHFSEHNWKTICQCSLWSAFCCITCPKPWWAHLGFFCCC